MASFQFVLSATTITLFLLVLSPSSNADLILDMEGNPLRNGGDYYILPYSKNSGGLVLKDALGILTCPLDITTAYPGEEGMPVKISSPFRIFNLPTSFPVELTFNSLIPFCGITPLRWWVTKSDANDNSHIVAGTPGPFKNTYAFLIEGSDAGENVYNIKFCHLLESKRIRKVSDEDDEKECRDVTILEDGTLGVSKNAPFPFVFKKKSSFPFVAANNM